MDLPTYTNIWRIEKRLYKLYDFRLPAPLPINWIAVFTGITVPYIVFLLAIGLPFNHSLVWLYVLPPGLLTWLTTRPVIESKRLPELLESQIRYLTEPRVWCRLAPLSEKDQIVVTARVWHSRRVPRQHKDAGTVVLRERGTLARRNRAAAAARTAASTATAAVTDETSQITTAAAAKSPAANGSSRLRARGRGTGTTGAAVRARSTEPRAAARTRMTRPRPIAEPLPPAGQTYAESQTPPVTQDPGITQTSDALLAAAPGHTPAATEVPAPGPAAQPGRFRVAALRSNPVGPAPALPPGVAIKPPANKPLANHWQAPPVSPPEPRRSTPPGPRLTEPAQPGDSGATLSGRGDRVQSRPAADNQPGQAPPVPGTRPVRPGPWLGPVSAPTPTGMPVHATPDVHPVPAGRERARGQTAPHVEVSHIEVSHSGPRPRPAPGIQPPAPNSRPIWPAQPLPSVTPPAPASPEAPAPPSCVASAPDTQSVDTFAVPGPVAPETANKSADAPRPDPAPPTPAPAQTQTPASDAEVAPPEPADLFPVSAVIATETRNKPEAPEPHPGAQPPIPAPLVKAVVESENQRVPSVERALSGPAKDRNLSWHGKVRIVVGATQGPGARDQEALDRARARLPLSGPRCVIMLGCTSGAGQTVTALMTGYILASLREQPVAALDLHDGSLARYNAPAAWLEDILSGKAPERRAPARPDGLSPTTPRDNPARLDVIASHEALKDGDERRLAEHLGRHYPLTMLDPGAAGLTRLLGVADQLVVVVPASVEASGALADTREWLDAHGFADLAANSVTLINGVSKRSMADVAQAESVARGRCRAIVRVPWDDMLPVGVTGPSTLRPQTRVAYTALAGVLVAGMAAAPIRKMQ